MERKIFTMDKPTPDVMTLRNGLTLKATKKFNGCIYYQTPPGRMYKAWSLFCINVVRYMDGDKVVGTVNGMNIGLSGSTFFNFAWTEWSWGLSMNSLIQWTKLNNWDFYDIDKNSLWEGCYINTPAVKEFKIIPDDEVIHITTDNIKFYTNGFDYRIYQLDRNLKSDIMKYWRSPQMYYNTGRMNHFINKETWMFLINLLLDIGELNGWDFYNPSNELKSFVANYNGGNVSMRIATEMIK